MEEDYTSCEAQYGERYSNKRFSKFNLQEAAINKLDIQWIVSLLGNRGDHRFTEINLFNFYVKNELNQGIEDEQFALVFAKLLKGRPYEEIGSVCEKFTINVGA